MVKDEFGGIYDEPLLKNNDTVEDDLIMKQRNIKDDKEDCLIEQKIRSDNKFDEGNQRKKSNVVISKCKFIEEEDNVKWKVKWKFKNEFISVKMVDISYEGKKKGRTRWRDINDLTYVKRRYKERNKYVWSILNVAMREENEFQTSTRDKNTIQNVSDNERNKFIMQEDEKMLVNDLYSSELNEVESKRELSDYIQFGERSLVTISKTIISVEPSNLEAI